MPTAGFLDPKQYVEVYTLPDGSQSTVPQELGAASRLYYLTSAWHEITRWELDPPDGISTLEYLERHAKAVSIQPSKVSSDRFLITFIDPTRKNIYGEPLGREIELDSSMALVPTRIVRFSGDQPRKFKLLCVSEMRYEGAVRGVPLVKQFRFFQYPSKEGSNTGILSLDQQVLETEILHQPPPDREFQPQSVGAPEYAAPSEPQTVSLWFILAILGMALIVFSVLTRWILNRRKSLNV
jgi:hypothetical protein